MIFINLNELIWIGLLCVIFGPLITHIAERTGKIVILDWILGGENPTTSQRERFRVAAFVFAIAGILCWYLGDGGTTYNLLLVILGYVFFLMAYIRYIRFKRSAKQPPTE